MELQFWGIHWNLRGHLQVQALLWCLPQLSRLLPLTTTWALIVTHALLPILLSWNFCTRSETSFNLFGYRICCHVWFGIWANWCENEIFACLSWKRGVNEATSRVRWTRQGEKKKTIIDFGSGSATLEADFRVADPKHFLFYF